jgi:hypothetical protein
MGITSRSLVLSLILRVALSNLAMLTVKPANAQSIPIPAVPQFTVRFVNASSTHNYLIEISIESQPFAYSNNGTLYQEYFNVRVKQHSAQNWTETYPIINGTRSFNGKGPTPLGTGNFSYAEYISPDSPMQSNSGARANFYVIPEEFQLENNTVFEGYSIQKIYSIWGAGQIDNHTFLEDIPIDGQLDFQVQAFVGHNSTIWYNISALWSGVGTYVSAVAYDVAGDWSNTQTITIGKTSPSPTPAVPEISAIIIVPLLLSVFSVAVIVRHRKTAS